MNIATNEILSSLQKKEYALALDKCEKFVSQCLSSFMNELTVNTATDFAGSTLLYANICSMIKKPWKCIPKLESAQGALRFMEDYITDKSILSETFHSFAEAYVRSGFIPEAIKLYYKEAFYAEKKDIVLEAISSFFYYLETVEEKQEFDLSFLKKKFSDDEIERIKKEASIEAENRILTDPIECTSVYLDIRYDLENRIDEILNHSDENEAPFCIRYWNIKKRILKEEFSIEWRSPEEMNPQIRFY